MSLQGPQQRPPFAGNSKMAGKTAPAAATTMMGTARLAPNVNANALTPFCRIDLAVDSPMLWDRYECSESDEAIVRLLEEELLELRYAEYRAYLHPGHHPTHSIRTTDFSSQTFWTIKRSQDGIAHLWIFRLKMSDKIAESSAAATRAERMHVVKSKEAVERCLSNLVSKKTSGQVMLRDVFPNSKLVDEGDPSVLFPVDEQVVLHCQLLQAVEDLLLSRWVWSQTDNNESSNRRESGPKPKEKTREDVHEDEEEEGAIDDATKQAKDTKERPQYWPKGDHSSILTRFHDGVLVQKPSPPSLMSGSDVPFDVFGPSYQQVVHFTLRSYLDETGHLFVGTHVQSMPALQHMMDVIPTNAGGVLAPTGIPVTFVERVAGLNWSDIDLEGVPKHSGDRPSESLRVLRKMLRLRGVNTDTLGSDWLVCETETKKRIIWPAELCFLNKSGEILFRRSTATTLNLSHKPLLELSERTKALVQESIGGRARTDNAAAIMISDEEMTEAEKALSAWRGDEGEDVDEGGDDDMDEVDEDADADAEDAKSEKGNGEHSKTKDTKEEDVIANADEYKGKDLLAPIDVRKHSGASSTSPAGEVKAQSASRDEDDTDLWGTFGFGPDDGDGKALLRRQSAAGIDESGFGLITEDDFSFFDDAARGGGAFDDLDMDLTAGAELLEQAGDETGQATEMDFSSDMAMTNSTFVDPPSLPGFTPGSLSATSPAVGGLNAKTPRTPFSPSQDMVDVSIAIGGEEDALMYHSDAYHPHGGYGLADMAPTHALQSRRDTQDATATGEKQRWIPQSRGALLSKYEEGKFALPDVPVRHTGSDGAGEKRDKVRDRETLRSRLRHRTHHIRRPSGGIIAMARNARKRPSHLLPLRPDEEGSDLEATVDGTVSERSSLVDEDSDGDDAFSSDDTSEEESVTLEDRVTCLQGAIEVLTARTSTPLPTDDAVLHEGSTVAGTELELAPFLRMMVVNPQVHLVVSAKPMGTTVPRSLQRLLFAAMPTTAERCTLGSLLAPPSDQSANRLPSAFHCLEPPKILIGCQGSITCMESSVLPYWDKVGLSPVSGPKKVVALALHCGCLPDSWQTEILDWFSAFNTIFSRTGLGSHSLAEDGLLGWGESGSTSIAQILARTAQNAEQWADTLESLLSRLQKPLREGLMTVIYSINTRTNTDYAWVYPKLQRDLRELAVKRWGISPGSITLWPMAWSSFVETRKCEREIGVNLQRMALSIYDSLDVPVQANHNLKSHLPAIASTPVGVPHPYVTLLPAGRLERPTTDFALAWNAEPFNLLDAGLILHAGYSLAKAPGDVTLIAIMDEKAQGYHVNGWRRQGSLLHELTRVWKEIQDYSLRARVLWRLVICKDEAMKRTEVEAWASLLKQPHAASLRCIDISLVCLDTQTPMTLVPPRRNREDSLEVVPMTSQGPAKAADGRDAHFINATQSDYAVYLPFRLDIYSRHDGRRDGSLLALSSAVIVSFSNQYNGAVVATDRTPHSTGWPKSASHHSWLHILQVYPTRHSKAQDPLPLAVRTRIFTKSMHQLTFIAKERFLLSDNLPWHISMLLTVRRGSKLM